MSRNLVAGVALMAVAMLLLPMGDSIAKYLMGLTPYSPGFLAWSRFALGIVVLIPLSMAIGAFRDVNRLLILQQAVRGALIASTITFILKGLETATLANAFGAFFVGPGIATLLAVILLRERVTGLEWFAVILGFMGVLLVVRPGGDVEVGVLWALLGGCCYGGSLVATRWAASNGRPITQLTLQFLFGCLFLLPLGIEGFGQHGLPMPGWLLAMGICSALSNLFSIMAMARAKAAYLAPVVYLQIVSATVITWWVFGDHVDLVALFGLGLIVCAGLTRIPYRRPVGE